MLKIKHKILLITVLLNTVFLMMNFTFATENSVITENAVSCDEIDCNGLEGDKKAECKKEEDKCKTLDKKAEKYEKIISLKRKQQNVLSNQVNVLNTDINEVRDDIKKNVKKIEKLNNDIENTIEKIAEKESAISDRKKLLAKFLQSYHENQGKLVISLFVGLDNFANITTGQDHFQKTGEKIYELTSSLQTLQNKLLREKKSLEAKKNIAVETRNKLNAEKARLAQTKTEKNSLLIETKGDEKKYEKKLARVEKQKQDLLGDIDQLYNANLTEISALASTLEKPTSGLASTSWYYSQKDSRWGNKRIGHSKSLMKDYGCAITDVAMVFTYHNKRISPGSLCKESIFYWDLINWPNYWQGINLVENTKHSGVSWSKINIYIKNKKPVIVFINAGRGGHYVVIHGKAKNGKYVVHDPYWGPNIYLDSSLKLLGSLYKKSLSLRAIDQMILYK